MEIIDNTPYSSEFQDVYFSRDGGPAESEHVFLHGNHLPERWQHRSVFTICETGFGTGLNFLATWKCWLGNAPEEARLHYVSVERHPLDVSSLRSCHALFPELDSLSGELRDLWPGNIPGYHRFMVADGRITLTLCHGEASEMLRELMASVDAWYLDGFSPSTNPSMWNDGVMREVARLSNPGTTFATFTVAGQVRHSLQAQGFRIRKVSGYGRKREMLTGSMETVPFIRPREPWFRPPSGNTGSRSAAVIGAGIAGAQIAHHLSRRGWSVTVFDRHDRSGMEASGGPAAVFSPFLTRTASMEEQYSLQSFTFLLHHLDRVDPEGSCHDRTGVLELSMNESDREREQRIASRFLPSWLVHAVTGRQAEALSDVECHSSGLFYPHAGWVRPDRWIRNLLAEPGIEVRTGTGITAVRHDGDQWHLHTRNAILPETYPVLILASGRYMDWPQLQGFPFTPVFGQTTSVKGNLFRQQPGCIIRHKGYVLPEIGGSHLIGSTFRRGSVASFSDPEADQENLDRLIRALPHILVRSAVSDQEVSPAHAAVRMSSENRFPLVGPVPVPKRMRTGFPLMHRRSYRPEHSESVYHPGLYLSAAWGSRGMTNAALGGEFLASLICEEPLPVQTCLFHALHPARSLIRTLKRLKG